MSIEWYLVIVASHIVAISTGYGMGIARPYLDKRLLRPNKPTTTASLPVVQKPTVP